MDKSMFITAIRDTVNTIYTGLSHEVHKGNKEARACQSVARPQATRPQVFGTKTSQYEARPPSWFLSTENIIYLITTMI